MAATPRPGIAAPAASDQPLDVSGLRVLVIDDKPIILEGIQVLMESWGCQVRTAEDGRQAMQVAQSWVRPPDIVISGLKLGDGPSGLDALNALARHYGSRSQPPSRRLLDPRQTNANTQPTK